MKLMNISRSKPASVLQLLVFRALDLLFQVLWHEIKPDKFPQPDMDFLCLFAQMTGEIL